MVNIKMFFFNIYYRIPYSHKCNKFCIEILEIDFKLMRTVSVGQEHINVCLE